MRKKSAILFLLLFAFAQYAKQLRFIECTLANALVSPGNAPCDCTKIAGLDQPDKHADLPVHVHGKIYIEDHFQLNREIVLITPWKDAAAKKNPQPVADEQDGNLQTPWHPPCS